MLLSISCDDPRFNKTNKLTTRSQPSVGKSCVKTTKDGTVIMLGQYFNTQKMAFSVLTTEDVMRLLGTGVLAIACNSDPFDTELPSIGQAWFKRSFCPRSC